MYTKVINFIKCILIIRRKKMKIGFTINLGDYQSMKIESSELENVRDCLREVYLALGNIENEKTKLFAESGIFEWVKQ